MQEGNAVGGVRTKVVGSVPVDRTRTPQQTFEALQREEPGLILHLKVMAAMPRVEGGFSATFVNLGCYVSCCELDEKLAKEGWGLIRDPQGLAELNEANPVFADAHPNGTQWPYVDRTYAYVDFRFWNGAKFVVCSYRDDSWGKDVWFPCRPLK